MLSSKSSTILDLGSGAGGPWSRLWRFFKKNGDHIRICLTDKYPNLAAFQRLGAISGNRIGFHRDPIDILNISGELTRFRTLFNAFHHFGPQDAQVILQDAITSGQGIAFFEITSRHPLTFFLMLGMPIMAWLFGFFMRPFRLSRLFWTYVIPAAPIIGFLDGIISCLRIYSIDEMKTLVKSLSPNSYRWTIGKERAALFSIPILYAIGIPENNPCKLCEFTNIQSQSTDNNIEE